MSNPYRARRLRFVSVALCVGAVLTACVPPANQPEDYAEPSTTYSFDDDGETVTTEVSQAQANFLEGCLGAGATPAECDCVFAYFVENVDFEVFEELDGEVADDPQALDPELQEGVRACSDRGAPEPQSDDDTEGPTTTSELE